MQWSSVSYCCTVLFWLMLALWHPLSVSLLTLASKIEPRPCYKAQRSHSPLSLRGLTEVIDHISFWCALLLHNLPSCWLPHSFRAQGKVRYLSSPRKALLLVCLTNGRGAKVNPSGLHAGTAQGSFQNAFRQNLWLTAWPRWNDGQWAWVI